ncbi:hypothetical protein L9F63_028045, partial [Diploptera punctata]
FASSFKELMSYKNKFTRIITSSYGITITRIEKTAASIVPGENLTISSALSQITSNYLNLNRKVNLAIGQVVYRGNFRSTQLRFIFLAQIGYVHYFP